MHLLQSLGKGVSVKHSPLQQSLSQDCARMPSWQSGLVAACTDLALLVFKGVEFL